MRPIVLLISVAFALSTFVIHRALAGEGCCWVEYGPHPLGCLGCDVSDCACVSGSCLGPHIHCFLDTAFPCLQQSGFRELDTEEYSCYLYSPKCTSSWDPCMGSYECYPSTVGAFYSGLKFERNVGVGTCTWP